MAHIDNPLLIHVAAASENRGRVVLAAQGGAPHPVAIGAAMDIAQAFDARIDCLLLECPQILALTAHSFAREVSYAGRIAPLSLAVLAETISGDVSKARDVISSLAGTRSVNMTAHVQRDSLSSALAKACSLDGPWNMVVLADAVKPADGPMLLGLLEEIGGATGLVLTGPRATQCSGDIVIVVEDIDRLPQMIRAGERLLDGPNGPSSDGKAPAVIRLLLAGSSHAAMLELDGLVRLLLPELAGLVRVPVEISQSRIAHFTREEVAEALRQLPARMIIARQGGLVVPPDGNISAVLSVLRCPLLLVR